MKPEKIKIPAKYAQKKSSFVKGATGPSFIVAFKFRFEEAKTIEEVLEFLERKSLASKGVSVYIDEDHAWVNFVFREFSSYSKLAPEVEINIAGVPVTPYQLVDEDEEKKDH